MSLVLALLLFTRDDIGAQISNVSSSSIEERDAAVADVDLAARAKGEFELK